MVRLIKNQKSKDAIEHNDFIFTKRKTYRGNITWRCKNRQCKASIKTPDNYNSLENIIFSGEHNHNNHAEEVKTLTIRNEIKERSARSFDSPRIITNSVLSGADEREIILAGSSHALSLLVHRTRSQHLPQEIRNVMDIQIPEDMRSTVRNEIFYQYGPDLDGYEDDNILIFCAGTSIDNLRAHSTWSVDGTFKTTPDLFYQLFTIGYIDGVHVFPSIFALLPNKQASTYNMMWRHIIASFPNLRPTMILTDFEKASINAIKRTFPESEFQGCFFHLCQCINRKLSECGLKRLYSTDISFKKIILKLAALAYLDSNEIRRTFWNIKESPSFRMEAEPIYSYFYTTYIGEDPEIVPIITEPAFIANLWRIKGSNIPRTNNAIEGWHNAFKNNFSNIHNSFYRFISILKNEEENINIKRIRINHGMKLPVNRRYTILNTLILECVSSRGNQSALEFIDIISDLIWFE